MMPSHTLFPTARLLVVSILGLLSTADKIPAQVPDASALPAYKVSVNLVKVPVAVLDEHGRTITGLQRNDFRLYEDGVLQEIQQFITNAEPVEAVLLLDISRSVQRESTKIRKAALQFAKALGRQSRFSVITFADEVEVVRDWTSDVRAIDKALHRISPGFRTCMYDGLYLAAENQLKDVEGKKAIILLTDGIDNDSRISYQQAAEALIRSQAAVYVIGLTNIVQPEMEKIYRIQYVARALENLGEKDPVKSYFDAKRRDLERFSLLTGGRTYFPLSFDELQATYRQVAEELKNKSYLTYVSSNQNTGHAYRKIQVRYRYEAATVLYRTGYYIKTP